jgi:hypothetical protein
MLLQARYDCGYAGGRDLRHARGLESDPDLPPSTLSRGRTAQTHQPLVEVDAGSPTIFEIDPLLCPRCGTAMNGVSVITELAVDAGPRQVVARRRRRRRERSTGGPRRLSQASQPPAARFDSTAGAQRRDTT